MLNNYHLAKVIDVDKNLLKPTVEIFLDTKKQSYINLKVVNLSEIEQLKIVSAESFEKWNVTQ